MNNCLLLAVTIWLLNPQALGDLRRQSSIERAQEKDQERQIGGAMPCRGLLFLQILIFQFKYPKIRLPFFSSSLGILCWITYICIIVYIIRYTY